MPQQRNTQQRQVIESILKKTGRPLLPKEILALAQQDLPSLGIATVFRALKALVSEGSVNTVYIGDESPRYEVTKDHHHHHFKCINCDKVYVLFNCPGNLKQLLPPGFEMHDHDITLFGRCADCADSAALAEV